MQVAAAAAARVARDRAVQCRLRRIELAAGRRVTERDVAEAQAALEQAIGRSTMAQARLSARLANPRRPRGAPVDSPRWSPGLPAQRDPAVLRTKITKLELSQVWTAYLGLGGHCTEFELDAFAHAALDLDAEEVAVLDQAVWELTEF
jgi:hypothetical protein